MKLAQAVWGDVRCEPLCREHAEAEVWRVVGARGTVGWLKRHRDAGRARREAQAVRAWGPALGWEDCTAVADGVWLTLPHQDGVPVTQATPSLYRAVGERLAALRACSVEPDPMPLQEALRRRVLSWDERSAGVVPESCRARVREAWREVPQVRRVACHRDVQLHNLLVRGDEVVILDLGQARPDLPAMDVAKLIEVPAELPEGCVEGLAEGLGDTVHRGWWERCRLLHGLATWVWGARHGDAAAVARAAEILVP